MIKKLFTNDLYVKVDRNKYEAKNLSTGSGWESSYADKPFTTDRLLVGVFSVAEPVLTKLVKKILQRGFITKSPQIVIHPVAMVDGGLSEVEERVFKELALGSGAIRVALHVGRELSDDEVITLIRGT